MALVIFVFKFALPFFLKFSKIYMYVTHNRAVELRHAMKFSISNENYSYVDCNLRL